MRTNIILSFLFLLISTNDVTANMGHRVGAGKKEYHKNLPENSIVALEAASLGVNGETPIMLHQDFEYFEFDIQETFDGELVLFHDKKLTRLFPDNEVNKEAYLKILKDPETRKRVGRSRVKIKHLKIKYLTIAQLKTLTFGSVVPGKIPTLNEFLSRARQLNVVKPFVFEIKYINTDKARQKFVQTVKDFRDGFMSKQDIIFEEGYDMDRSGAAFLTFSKNFKKSFPGKKMWCNYFKENGFKKVYRALRHSKYICK